MTLLVIFLSITNYPIHTGLKQQVLFLSQFMWVRSPGVGELGLLAQGLSEAAGWVLGFWCLQVTRAGPPPRASVLAASWLQSEFLATGGPLYGASHLTACCLREGLSSRTWSR